VVIQEAGPQEQAVIDPVIDSVAEAIYHSHFGLGCVGYLLAHGDACKAWITSDAWDTNPEELCEHERDEYRDMAKAAIAAYLAAASGDDLRLTPEGSEVIAELIRHPPSPSEGLKHALERKR
jgi:hypothetical protein